MNGRTLSALLVGLLGIALSTPAVARPRQVPRLALWIEPGANLPSLSTVEGVRRVLDRAKAVGFDTVVFEAKNAWGYVTYPSAFAPVLNRSQVPRTTPPGYPPPATWLPPDYDLLGTVIREARARGLRVHAAVNTFSEGLTPNRAGPAFERTDWPAVAYVATRPVTAPDGTSYELDGADVVRFTDQLVLYTRRSGERAPTSGHGVEVVVVRGRVVEVRDRAGTEPDPGPAPIPADGYVLAGHGRAAEWLRRSLPVGSPVEIGPVRVRMVPGYERSLFAFVNPGHPEVRLYELAVLHELLKRYDLDGVVLDRTRYEDLTQDFSESSRRAFEEYLGRPVTRWPEDVYRYVPQGEWVAREPGPLYRAWLGFRARTIRSYVLSAARLIRALRPEIAVGMYVGGWYPVYYEEGVNWAHPSVRPPYPWVDEAWVRAGLAPLLDYLMVGLYYRPVTVWEALRGGTNPVYSVEGGWRLVRSLVTDEVPVVASLFLPHYAGDPDRLRQALRAARGAAGVMLFDLVYLTEDLWALLSGR
jgi:uncharacterized lipoprotein YddW (UPF0748 family)